MGGLIFLTGEAGMGKSRLIREARIIAHASDLTFHEVAPLSFEVTQPYALFRSFLRQLTGVGEVDSIEEAYPKLIALAERLPIEVRAGVTGAFASVLGVLDDMDGQIANGESFQRQLFATAREAVQLHFAKYRG
ncbi:MAG: ATP-binding protein [Anaerolineae bacterium]|nr:ATP-binding protein [Anaerolineae bacterium]